MRGKQEVALASSAALSADSKQSPPKCFFMRTGENNSATKKHRGERCKAFKAGESLRGPAPS